MAESEETTVAAGGSSRRLLVTRILLAALALGGVAYGTRVYHFYAHHAETDDAFIEGHIAPVLPRISGYVQEVRANDNQAVKAGDVLVTIDTRDLAAKAEQAQAALAAAEAQATAAEAQHASARSQASVARANVAAVTSRLERAQADLKRYEALRARQDIPLQVYDAAHSAADTAQAEVDAARRQVTTAEAQIAAAAAQIGNAKALIAQKQADLDYAKLQLSYGTVAAPADGIVSKRNVEPGQLVQAGQPLMAIVASEEVWVVANYKETQIRRMRPGQPVEVEIDAYPNHVFHGRIDSLSAATGAKFALLPPDNATGNFTKVVQRIPVKIVITDPPDPARPLRAGMSVNAIVDLG